MPARTLTGPARDELQRAIYQLSRTVSHAPHGAERMPPLGALLACDLAQRIKDDPAQGTTWWMGPLAAVVKETALAVERTRATTDAPATAPDLSAFAPVEAAVREVIALDAAAKRASVLVQTGLVPAMEEARSAVLLSSLFDLMVAALDRCGQVMADGGKVAKAEAGMAARLLAGRRRDDLLPYARRLRERHPPAK